MSNFRCKGICQNLKGYGRGYYHFHILNMAYCVICDYKIKTSRIRCQCCSNIFRRSRRKDYPHLKREYHIAPTTAPLGDFLLYTDDIQGNEYDFYDAKRTASGYLEYKKN